MKAAVARKDHPLTQATLEKPLAPPDASFVAFVREATAFDFLWHLHAEYELTLIVHGQGRRFVGDNVARFEPGDLVLLGPNLPHTYVSERDSSNDRAPARAVVVQFAHDFLGGAFFGQPELRQIERLLQRAQFGLRFHGPTRDRAARQLLGLERQHGFARLCTLLQVLDMLAHTDQVGELSSPGFLPSVRKDDDVRVRQFCEYVDANITEPLSLRAAAAHMHMSPRTLTRFLKRTLGKTFVDYVNELRVGHACAQLINTASTINEICFESGFRSLSHFNRRFHALKRSTPREYRRAHQP